MSNLSRAIDSISKMTDAQKHDYLISRKWVKLDGARFMYHNNKMVVTCGIDQAVKLQVTCDKLEKKLC